MPVDTSKSPVVVDIGAPDDNIALVMVCAASIEAPLSSKNRTSILIDVEFAQEIEIKTEDSLRTNSGSEFEF